MNKYVAAAAMSMLLSTAANAANIGITMSAFDDNFLTVLRNAMLEYADQVGGVEIQIEDAQNEVGKQLNQIQNFVASGVDAIIVNTVDSDATIAMTNLAADAGIPLVFVNREPANLETLPDNQAYVGSKEVDAGRLEAEYACNYFKEKGKTDKVDVAIMMGDLSNAASRLRTQGAEDVMAEDACNFMHVVEKQTAMWLRTPGADLMTNWLTAGLHFDAVISNNDEMAIGAIQAMKTAGISMDDVVVTGVDGTVDAMAMIRSGDMDMTVFQNAAGQGEGAVAAALALAGGEDVDQVTWIPFEPVTIANLSEYETSN